MAVAMTVALGVTAPAWAGATSKRTSGVEHVTSGSWGAQGTTLSWGVLGLLSTSYQYFTVPNTGTLNLVSATYSTTSGGLALGTSVTFTACVGATWSTGGSGSCSGTKISLGQAGGGAVTAATPIAAGASLSVQAKAVVGLASLAMTTTTTVTVARNNVRAAKTTNS